MTTTRFEEFDAAALADIKARSIPKLCAADIFTPDKPDDPECIEMMSAADKYLAAFAALGERDPVWGSRLCICCGAMLTGLLGSFQWGIAHGEGSCLCGYPARAIHNIPGVGKLSNVVLQYHPDELSFQAKEAASG